MNGVTVEHRGRAYAAEPKLARPLPLFVPGWVKARGEVCGACGHQVVTPEFDEKCELRPEWGCLGKARHRRDRECPNGLWASSPP
jgi:hypothetical protein